MDVTSVEFLNSLDNQDLLRLQANLSFLMERRGISIEEEKEEKPKSVTENARRFDDGRVKEIKDNVSPFRGNTLEKPAGDNASRFRSDAPSKEKHAEIYVDGSYDPSNDRFGYGVYMTIGDKEHTFSGLGDCLEGGRNIEGEVAASEAAIKYCLENGISSAKIYHDYKGIGEWGDGNWKTNKMYTQAYKSFVADARGKGLDVEFEHVPGHEGILGNEIADALAKQSIGIDDAATQRAIRKARQAQAEGKLERNLPDDVFSEKSISDFELD